MVGAAHTRRNRRLHAASAPTVVVAPAVEKSVSGQAKARVDEPARVATPEPEAARGGLTSLLGGWWGRNRK